MKLIKIAFLFIITLHLFSCSTQDKKIYHLQDTYDARFYIFDGYRDDYESIKYIFDFSERNLGYFFVLTNKKEVYFEDGVYWFKKRYQKFIFEKKRVGNYYKSVRLNFLENTPIHFSIKVINYQTYITADFKTLTVNTVQNFLDYAEKDESKKETENYTYILYNKDNQEKMKLKYHDKGAWFEVEIL